MFLTDIDAREWLQFLTVGFSNWVEGLHEDAVPKTLEVSLSSVINECLGCGNRHVFHHPASGSCRQRPLRSHDLKLSTFVSRRSIPATAHVCVISSSVRIYMHSGEFKMAHFACFHSVLIVVIPGIFMRNFQEVEQLYNTRLFLLFLLYLLLFIILYWNLSWLTTLPFTIFGFTSDFLSSFSFPFVAAFRWYWETLLFLRK